MNLYFDNAAATPVAHDVLLHYMRLEEEFPGNQEAMGAIPLRRRLQSASRGFITAFCGKSFSDDYDVCWTSSGTDSVRISFLALASACESGDILYTDAEHASVLAAIQRLPMQKFRHVSIKLLSNGRIDPLDFEQKLSIQTRIVCIHWVQSETGCVQDLVLLRRIMSRKAPEALLIVDSIQGMGKMLFPFDRVFPDIALFSGQKFGLPVGGALVFHAPLKQFILPIRSVMHEIGRIPPAFILLFAEYFVKRMENISETVENMSRLRAFLLTELDKSLPPGSWRKTIPDEVASPWILHLMLDGRPKLYQGAIIVRSLSAKNILIASGSACNAETDTPSSALMAMGIPERCAWSGIRISFFDGNTEAQCVALSSALSAAILDY